MKSLRTVLLFSTFISFYQRDAFALGEVRSICEKTGVKVFDLKAHDQIANRAIVQKLDPGSNAILKYLKEVNAKKSELKKLEELASAGNEKLAPDSKWKTSFTRFANEKPRQVAKDAYRALVISAINEFVPKSLNRLDWFLNLKESWVDSTALRPAADTQIGDIYGAIMRGRPTEDGRHTLEIIFSNNSSEPIVYLVPLIIHELQHAASYHERIRITDQRSRMVADFVDEAIAYDLQMQAYVAVAKRNPELFCNWLYPTWLYGELVIPLSWSMSSMETDLHSGKFLYEYAKVGSYGAEEYLLNADGSDLRADIKAKISALKLKYLK